MPRIVKGQLGTTENILSLLVIASGRSSAHPLRSARDGPESREQLATQQEADQAFVLPSPENGVAGDLEAMKQPD